MGLAVSLFHVALLLLAFIMSKALGFTREEQVKE